MEDARDGDLRVPLISSLFFVLVFAGGIFLTCYVFAPNISQPWFPGLALILIGSPWVFWLLTYLYTCFKGCCGKELPYTHDHAYSRRGFPSHPVTPRRSTVSNQTTKAMSRSWSVDGSPQDQAIELNNVASRHVHFGEEVLVVESDGSKVVHEMESWTNSNKSTQTSSNES
ncbi:hypothetical protein SSX86_027181 [Deinandra increscens subsp. villosa]|uniref:Transmembrane protein n=1 Tax=Deinandra increscens subsp. villosa TaxID=3103831 RepID=A0AAP0CMM1_9ASTR